MKDEMDPGFHDLSCAVHVHSDYSDGNATVAEIVAAARTAGRDAVLLSDHDTLGAAEDGWGGWHDDVLLLVGHEVSPRGGHLLVFGPGETIGHVGRSEAQVLAEAKRAGAVTIAAHPFSRGSRISRRIAPPHGWSALTDPNLDGIELWSLLTDEGESWRGPREALRFLRDPATAISAPPAESIAAWDRLCSSRPLVALGGLDAHQPGPRIRGRVRSPLHYERIFPLLGTHFLLERPPNGDSRADTALLLDAIAGGRCYLSLDALGDPRGFGFRLDGKRPAVIGGTTAFDGGGTLVADIPGRASIRLLRDGTELARRDGTRLEHPPDGPGAYRVEAWRSWRGRERLWILGNPIYLRER